MDNITHTLFAATLARAVPGTGGRGATAALLLASNAPDIDIVATAGGAMAYLQWHRGPTHGALGIVALGLVTAGLVFGLRRLADRRPRGPRLGLMPQVRQATSPPPAEQPANASFGTLVAVSIAGVLLHVLMDLPTSYGTRLLSPFRWQWYAVDWMPIVDIYVLLALAAGLVFVRSDTGRRRNALIVFTLMAGNYGLRAAAHERALAAAPRVFGPLLPAACEGVAPRQGLDRWPRLLPAAPREAGRQCLVEIAATPGFGSPFHWRLIVQLSNGYHVRTINVLNPGPIDDETWRLTDAVPNVWTPAVAHAAETRPAQLFLGFARFPAVRVSVDRDGVATVQWTDLRFSAGPNPPRPQNDGRGDLFGATVRIGSNGRVLAARIGGR